jgi:nucleotidyltransferase substrate binding protein (TIGR01987 family)
MEKTVIDFSKLLKAQAVFERVRRDMQDERDQMGAVQAFEFCYELAWKMMKRVLAVQGLNVEAPKDIFRKAALVKLIDDPEIWFDFQEKRNLGLYVYDQENLIAIVETFDLFSAEFEKVIQGMQAEIMQKSSYGSTSSPRTGEGFYNPFVLSLSKETNVKSISGNIHD